MTAPDHIVYVVDDDPCVREALTELGDGVAAEAAAGGNQRADQGLDLAGVTCVQEEARFGSLEWMFGGPLEIGLFLRLAVGLAAALRELHGRGIIHKDIKPANVLVDASTAQVRLTGFGIASRLRRERQAPEPPEVIAGSLPYMAPEQTGRMNRSIDSRS